jgi:hypothetical protein
MYILFEVSICQQVESENNVWMCLEKDEKKLITCIPYLYLYIFHRSEFNIVEIAYFSESLIMAIQMNISPSGSCNVKSMYYY